MLLAVVLGLPVGLVMGALGGGGSLLTVPVLVYALGQPAGSAAAGSLVVVAAASLAGAVAQHRAGRVRVATGLAFGGLGAAGSYAGARAAGALDPDVLLVAFAGLMAVVAVAMLTSGRRRGPRAPVTPGPLRVVAAATAVGLVTGFFGVGGGFLVVPALTLALGLDARTAIGTSLLVVAVNAAVAFAARLGDAPVDWSVVAAFAAAAVAGSLGGVRLARRVAPERLTAAFGVLLLVVAAYVAARAVPALGS